MTAIELASTTGLTRRARTAIAVANRAVEVMAIYFRARRNRAAILRLGECSDYMLHDIGVTRADLHSVLGGSPFDDPSERLGVLAEMRIRQKAARRIA